MNVRSRFSHELNNIIRHTYDVDSSVESLKQQMNELSSGLKDAKFHLEKAGLSIKPNTNLQHHYRYEDEDKEHVFDKDAGLSISGHNSSSNTTT